MHKRFTIALQVACGFAGGASGRGGLGKGKGGKPARRCEDLVFSDGSEVGQCQPESLADVSESRWCQPESLADVPESRWCQPESLAEVLESRWCEFPLEIGEGEQPTALECGSLLPLSPASLLAVSRTDAPRHFTPNASLTRKTLLLRHSKSLNASRLAPKSGSRLPHSKGFAPYRHAKLG